jgi:hypothetical protein
MQYSAKGQMNRNLTVYNERKEVVGQVVYTSIFSRKAQIYTSDNAVYDVRPTGFWLNKVEISRDGVPIVLLKYSLGAGMTIWFENGMSFTMRRKSIWRYDLIVMDNDGYEVASIYVRYVWRTLNYEYEIDIQLKTPDQNIDKLLSVVLAYCAQFLRFKRGYAQA